MPLIYSGVDTTQVVSPWTEDETHAAITHTNSALSTMVSVTAFAATGVGAGATTAPTINGITYGGEAMEFDASESYDSASGLEFAGTIVQFFLIKGAGLLPGPSSVDVKVSVTHGSGGLTAFGGIGITSWEGGGVVVSSNSDLSLDTTVTTMELGGVDADGWYQSSAWMSQTDVSGGPPGWTRWLSPANSGFFGEFVAGGAGETSTYTASFTRPACMQVGFGVVDVAEGIIEITGPPLPGDLGPVGAGQDTPFQMGGWPGYTPRDLSMFTYNYLKTGKQIQKVLKRVRIV